MRTSEKTCRRGLHQYAAELQRCPECTREANRARRLTLAAVARRQTPKAKAAARLACLKWRQSQRGQELRKAYKQRPGVRAKENERSKKYAKQHRPERAKYRRDRLRGNPAARLASQMLNLTGRAVKATRTLKAGHTFELVGCTGAELREYLEAQWLPGMSWENHGTRWHTDHLKPLATWGLRSPDQQRAAFHYTNLAPKWAQDNLSKHDSEQPACLAQWENARMGLGFWVSEFSETGDPRGPKMKEQHDAINRGVREASKVAEAVAA